MPRQSLTRLDSFEGGLVKFALANKDESTIVTLIQSSTDPDEMAIRISSQNGRFSLPGHKSIMDQWSFEDFQKKVEKRLGR